MSLPPPDLIPGESARLAAPRRRPRCRRGRSPRSPTRPSTARRPARHRRDAARPGAHRLRARERRPRRDPRRRRARLSPAIVEAPARLDAVSPRARRVLRGSPRGFDLPLDWARRRRLSPPRLQACARIPFGATSTYKQMAIAAGSPTAFRAAGGALGSNPIPIVVPCHRVLSSSGGLAATPAAWIASACCCDRGRASHLPRTLN